MSDSKKSILLVEDEVILAMMEQRELIKKGYMVHHVNSGEKAVQAITDNSIPVDLILMDIDLGQGMDGTQAAEKILNHKDIPIVFYSSHTETDIVEKTENITSYGYVVKNTGIMVLDASIKMALKLFKAKEERKQAEKELFTSERKIRAILEQSNQFIGILTTDGIVIDVNKYALNFSGVSISDVCNKPFWDTVWWAHSPKLQARLREAVKAAAAGEFIHFEVTHQSVDGNLHYVDFTLQPVKDDAGKIIFLVPMGFDITEHKRAEEEIKKQLAEKEILLKEVHHRVKNNITNIESFLYFQAGEHANPEIKAILQQAVSRIQSMRVLYERLLVEDEYQDISIKEYVESLIDSIKTVFSESSKIKIETVISDFSLSAKKASSIGIIINELLVNIIKYAFVGYESGRALIRLEKNGNKIILAVSDNGVGIDERITANQSPGVGLVIIKMLAEQLNGTFTMSKDKGTKSVVQFEIES